MKRSALQRFLACAAITASAALVLQNCAKIQPDDIIKTGLIRAGIEDGTGATRTCLGEGNTVLWQEDDQAASMPLHPLPW